MKTVSVTASRNYNILIASGLLLQLGAQVATLGKIQTVALVSETNVYPLYGKQAEDSLRQAGLNVVSFVFPAGESSKNANVYLELLNFLAKNRLTRTDALVALGGGVVGDLTGFAAATYLRGIRFVQVPTTLLAAVDSSVGGKTAIDLEVGKNLVGAFWQPSLVLCDTDTLNTLPREIFLDGCAEVIKYAILYDNDFFHYLASTGPDFDKAYVIERCVTMKRDVVARDEFDNGERRLLNLGHTVGHGVEAKSNFTLSHGKSVAIGTAIVARSAVNYQLLSPECATKIENILRDFCLPVRTQDSAKELASFALSDKKRTGGTVSLVVPRAIGRCEILSTPVEELENFIQAGL